MTPSPLWFPLTLILYGEGSYCSLTRKCARFLLYMYILTRIITSYMTDVEMSFITAYTLIIVGYVYCMIVSERAIGVVLFCIMSLAMTYVASAIVFNTMEYDIVIEGFSILKNSSYVYREGTLIALSMCSFLTLEDYRVSDRENALSIIAGILWFLN